MNEKTKLISVSFVGGFLCGYLYHPFIKCIKKKIQMPTTKN